MTRKIYVITLLPIIPICAAFAWASHFDVVEDAYLLVVHPRRALDNIAHYIWSVGGCNFLLRLAEPAPANNLLRGIAEFMKGVVEDGARFLVRHSGCANSKHAVVVEEHLHNLL